MSEGPGLPARALRIDEACERYEAAWRAGAPRPLEAALDEAGLPEAERPRLFLELLLLELELRRGAGQAVDRDDYRARFPAFAREVESAFVPETTATAPAGAAGAADTLTLVRYQVGGLISQGGLGRIFEARDLALDRTMALKEVRPDRDAPDTRARLVREGRINGRLEHPGIVPVFGLGCHPDGRPYYVMRLVEGEHLGAAVARFHGESREASDPAGRPPALNDLLAHVVTVCDAVDYAHSRGVIHRDLKPANVMLGRFGETLVVDWGLARPFGPSWRPADLEDAGPTEYAPEAPTGPFETTHGQTVGTPWYMSPEQASGRPDRLGPASDIYSLGALLYEVLTGRPPFGDTTDPVAILRRVVAGDLARPRQVRSQTPRALEAVCLRAMASRPDDRYASARALADDLRRWLAGEPVSARRESWPERAGRWARRHRVVAASAVSAAVVALAVGVPVAVRQRVARLEQEVRAAGRVEALVTAETDELPGLIHGIDSAPDLYRPLLGERFRDPGLDPDGRLHVALALAATGGDADAYLTDRLLDAELPVLPLVWQALARDNRPPPPDRLWGVVDAGDPAADDGRALRAALALARFDPPRSDAGADAGRWAGRAERVVSWALTGVINEPARFDLIAGTFHPARRALFGALAARFRADAPDAADPTRAARRLVAALFLERYADWPEALAELIQDAPEGPQRRRFVGRLRASGEPAVRALTAVLRRDDARTPPGGPDDPEGRRGAAARRKARVAAALVEIGRPDVVWESLASATDPTVSTELIPTLASTGRAGLRAIVERLDARDALPARTRRALILALGDAPDGSLTAAERQVVSDRLVERFRLDPDPGVHAAAGWVLRHRWGQAARVERAERSLARRDAEPGRDWYVNGEGQTLAVVRGPVTARVGSPPGEPGRDDSEPPRTRRIGHTFALGLREVSLGEFRRFLRDGGGPAAPLDDPEFRRVTTSDEDPAVGITWFEAAGYCNWLSRAERIPEDQWCYPPATAEGMPLDATLVGRTGYRLPTEAEWELACRAGAETSRPFGAAWDRAADHGWFLENAGGHLHPIGLLKPNGLGLFDALGNAAEWTLDRYEIFPDPPAGGAGDPPDVLTPGPVSGRQSRVVKGGSVFGPARPRSAGRDGGFPSNRSPQVGFRVARTCP